MTRLVLIVVLMLLSSGRVYAEWVVVGTKDGMTTYFDPATIRHKGNMVKMWSFLDFKTVTTIAGYSFLSSKTQFEYDCVEETARILAYTWFSGNMGGGTVVGSDSDPDHPDPDRWHPVEPGSVGQTLWKIACGKK